MKVLIRHYPAIAYFVITYIISWSGAFILVAPKLLHGVPIGKMDGIIMFPIMLAGPFFTGIILNYTLDGKAGLRGLFSKMGRGGVGFRWYAPLLIPPVVIIAVLLFLSAFFSPHFAPNFFLLSILFGIPAGFFEETGWMGFAFPRLNLRYSAFKASVILGIFWGLWHLPVIDFLGAASPHGAYLVPFSLSFIVLMTAMRVLIAWIYTNTKSILLCQLMHASSTGFLVMFGPPHVSPAQETLWYAVYAAALWAIVLVIKKIYGPGLYIKLVKKVPA